jgi:nicotinamidase/pyrazinamidase
MHKKILFWNTDTQKDFMEKNGKLYVEGAEDIKPNLACLTSIAKENDIQVINTADWHYMESAEIAEEPDWIYTFPEHCMVGSEGAEFVDETKPELAIKVDWNKEYHYDDLSETAKAHNIILLKDDFDTFKGNKNVDKLLMLLKPDIVIVYGVTSNICVDKAVRGLIDRKYEVYVVRDAIKKLPHLPSPLKNWEALGAKLINTKDVAEVISNL